MNGWAEPVIIGRSINTEKYYENYPTVTSDGTIYYMNRREVGVVGMSQQHLLGGCTYYWRFEATWIIAIRILLRLLCRLFLDSKIIGRVRIGIDLHFYSSRKSA